MKEQVVPDIIAANLEILFCGINPGLLSAATAHHFARPGNRFWKALYTSGLTPVLLQPAQQQQLLQYGIGITNFVTRASAAASELATTEFVGGAARLQKKVKKYSPKVLAILGIDAYKKGFEKKFVTLGRQADTIGKTQIWVLPNPSGLNAHYSLEDFTLLFAQLKNGG